MRIDEPWRNHLAHSVHNLGSGYVSAAREDVRDLAIVSNQHRTVLNDATTYTQYSTATNQNHGSPFSGSAPRFASVSEL